MHYCHYFRSGDVLLWSLHVMCHCNRFTLCRAVNDVVIAGMVQALIRYQEIGPTEIHRLHLADPGDKLKFWTTFSEFQMRGRPDLDPWGHHIHNSNAATRVEMIILDDHISERTTKNNDDWGEALSGEVIRACTSYNRSKNSFRFEGIAVEVLSDFWGMWPAPVCAACVFLFSSSS